MPVRRGSKADATGIGRVHALSRQAAYQGLVPDDALSAITPETQTPYWRSRFEEEREPHALHVFHVGDTTEGFAFGSSDRQTATLNAIHVMPGIRGTGAGRALHDALLADFVAWGCTTARLYVLEGNLSAQAFYVRQGWRSDEVRSVHELGGVVVSIVRFSRSLGA
jgi:ribosomal protein S18 acetylase RimI-like enzyme